MMTGELVILPADQILERFAVLSASVERIEKSLSLKKSRPATGDRLLNKYEAAKILGCSVSTIDNLRRAGKLSRVNVGKAVRFRLSDVERLMH